MLLQALLKLAAHFGKLILIPRSEDEQSELSK
jgi:hypothetical protein